MEKKHIRKEIAALIDSIKEHSDTIGEKEHIPQLELELILHKIEKLYQKSIVYNHLNSVQEMNAIAQPEKKEEKIVPPAPKSEPPVHEPPKAEPPVIEPPKPEPKKEEPPKEEPKPEILPEIKPEPKPEPPKEEKKPEITEEKKEEPKPEVKPVDLFGSALPPVSDKPKVEKKPVQKDNPTQVPISKIQKPPVADLRAAIGINDRFQFANELFGGEMQECEIAIQQLNTAGTLDSAQDYLGSLQQLYSWDKEHDTVKRLSELVERRYS